MTCIEDQMMGAIEEIRAVSTHVDDLLDLFDYATPEARGSALQVIEGHQQNLDSARRHLKRRTANT